MRGHIWALFTAVWLVGCSKFNEVPPYSATPDAAPGPPAAVDAPVPPWAVDASLGSISSGAGMDAPTSDASGNPSVVPDAHQGSASLDGAALPPPVTCDKEACSAAVKDGCCPASCDSASDADCSPTCGNSRIEPGETCDPPGTCVQTCPNRGCTAFHLEGNPDQCTSKCTESGPITACKNGDGCCAKGCTALNDNDCGIVCGNGVVEGGETCDPLSTCPSFCSAQGCQLKKVVNSGTCFAECVNDRLQTACISGDGCCPAGSVCDAIRDRDCPARCGNGTVEPGEACDGNCVTDCPSQGCTKRALQGSADRCNAKCVNAGTVTACVSGDGCCPGGCHHDEDSDCPQQCSGTGKTCMNSTTLRSCVGGTFETQKCPGGGNCFDDPQGGGPRCGCKIQACTCDVATNSTSTSCGIFGVPAIGIGCISSPPIGGCLNPKGKCVNDDEHLNDCP
jgi:hypothetical protein